MWPVSTASLAEKNLSDLVVIDRLNTGISCMRNLFMLALQWRWNFWRAGGATRQVTYVSYRRNQITYRPSHYCRLWSVIPLCPYIAADQSATVANGGPYLHPEDGSRILLI